MKLYIPDINDILKLKTSWSINLQHTYRNQPILMFFGCNEDCDYQNRDNVTRVTFPVGAELKVSSFNVKKNSNTNCISLTLCKYNGEKKNIEFNANLKDVNRIEIDSKPSLGVIKFIYRWAGWDMPEKHKSIRDINTEKQKTMTCFINNKESFRISVVDLEIIEDVNTYGSNAYKKTRVSSVKYKLECLSTGNEIGQWTTLDTMKKKAKEYMNNNKKFYLDEDQKMILREEKLSRIVIDEE